MEAPSRARAAQPAALPEIQPAPQNVAHIIKARCFEYSHEKRHLLLARLCRATKAAVRLATVRFFESLVEEFSLKPDNHRKCRDKSSQC